ncbi:MAG: A/G-specific adenine glycosylase [Mariprofundaceae bacterium]
MSSSHCKDLFDWYQAKARNLPWRNTRDPYAIWISEIMLQQTQVKTVLPRFQIWFERFPDIHTLAQASLDEVLKAWEGLGYYRRARFIHQSAQIIVEKYQGHFPENFDDILALYGIGRSTAGAISSFCFDTPTPVLDGNVKRVLKRWHQTQKATDKQLWDWAQQAIDSSTNPAIWNQLMMELGATICLPRKANCQRCPASQFCQSAFEVDLELATIKSKSPAVIDVHWQVILHTDVNKGIWLNQRPDSGIWASLWTPPIIELSDAPDLTPCHIHLLTHRRIHLYALQETTEPSGHGQWVKDIQQLALPTGIHRLLAKKELSS